MAVHVGCVLACTCIDLQYKWYACSVVSYSYFPTFFEWVFLPQRSPEVSPDVVLGGSNAGVLGDRAATFVAPPVSPPPDGCLLNVSRPTPAQNGWMGDPFCSQGWLPWVICLFCELVQWYEGYNRHGLTSCLFGGLRHESMHACLPACILCHNPRAIRTSKYPMQVAHPNRFARLPSASSALIPQKS